MDYSKMSDFEINCAVAATLGKECFHNSHGEPGRRRKAFVIDERCRDVYESGCWSSDVFDPCNNPADAWPVIVSDRIGLNFVNGIWRAQSMMTGWVEFSHENPLRAAMIVYLQMQESANVQDNPSR
ncbi:TPA: phage protein NinX family protein [Citrobacter freundii]